MGLEEPDKLAELVLDRLAVEVPEGVVEGDSETEEEVEGDSEIEGETEAVMEGEGVLLSQTQVLVL